MHNGRVCCVTEGCLSHGTDVPCNEREVPCNGRICHVTVVRVVLIGPSTVVGRPGRVFNIVTPQLITMVAIPFEVTIFVICHYIIYTWTTAGAGLVKVYLEPVSP